MASGRAKVHSDGSSRTGHEPLLKRPAPPPVLQQQPCNEGMGTLKKLKKVRVEAGMVQSGGETPIPLLDSSILETKTFRWPVFINKGSEIRRKCVPVRYWLKGVGNFVEEVQHSLFASRVRLSTVSDTQLVLCIISKYEETIYSL